jgi:hypothetical protein
MASKTASVIGMKTWQALHLYQTQNLWVGIGKTSPWEGETVSVSEPPDVNVMDKAISELVLLKKASEIKLVAPDEAGTIEVQGIKYKEVLPNDARTENVKMLYAAASIQFEECPTIEYRQIGLFADPVLKSTTPPGKLVLLPNEVDDVGFLLSINNRSRVPHDSDSEETWKFVCEF